MRPLLKVLLFSMVSWVCGLRAQSPVTIADSSKPAVETLRMIAQRIGECPRVLAKEVRWGKKADEIERYYYDAPLNVVWNVVEGNSVRAPYLAYIEFAVNEDHWVPPSASNRFSSSGASVSYIAGFGFYSPHFRYEYDLGPDGLQLMRALLRYKASDGWRDVGSEFAGSCWGIASRNTQAQAASVPQPSTSGSHLQVDVVPLSGNIELIKEQAANGEASAEVQLGYAYESGQGVRQDSLSLFFGTAKLPSRGMLMRNTILGGCMSKVMECRRTKLRAHFGGARPPSKATD
jgi:hypothetical protein